MNSKVASFIVLTAVLVFISGCGRVDEPASTRPVQVENPDTALMPEDNASQGPVESEVKSVSSTTPSVRVEAVAEVEPETTAVALDPLAAALRSGRPVVADFGRGTCVPCKMMEPILKKLQQDYEGRAEILILDIDEYASLTREYRIMVIPTQIFFDASGQEVERHQGFMPEADIIARLRSMGIE